VSAETLRRAAALMRERAEAARAGRWLADGSELFADWEDSRYIGVCDGSLAEGNVANAEHIASWHPAVALAVADWLDAQAADVESFVDGEVGWVTVEWRAANTAALIVARAYLGEVAQ
jgi:hypothetical protein